MCALLDKTTNLMIPSGYKAGTLYSVLPNTSAGDFDVARTSGTSRIDSDLMIENIAANVPNLSYVTAGGCPRLQTHDAYTQLITYSNDFGNSYFTKSGSTIEGNPATAGSELVTNGDFSVWTGDDPDDWTIGSEDASNKITEVGAGANMISDNTAAINMSQTILTTDIFYQYTITISAGATGGFKYKFGSAASETAVADASLLQTYTGYIVGTGTTFTIQRNGTCNIVFEDVTIKAVQGYQSPSTDYPLEAYKLVEDGSTGQHMIYSGAISTQIGVDNTTTFYIKAGERSWAYIQSNSAKRVWFDLENGVIGTEETGGVGSIKAMANGWYKCSNTWVDVNTSDASYVCVADADGSYSYTGTAGNGIYIFGANLSETSYSPPYAYTSGSTASITADAVNNAVYSGDSESGCLMVEMASFTSNASALVSSISISDGTNDNTIRLEYSGATNQVRAIVKVATVPVASLTYTVADLTAFNKALISWEEDSFILTVNGVDRANDTGGVTFGSEVLTTINLDRGDGNSDYYGKINQIVTTELLTPAERVTITTQ